MGNISREALQRMSPEQRRDYLANKYAKRDYNIEDLRPKFVVWFTPSVIHVKDWTFLCVCDTIEQAKQEILWRKKYHETGDTDLVLDNDKRFETFRDETKNVDENGFAYEPGQELMNIDYNTSRNMLQVIADSNVPQADNNRNFRGMAYYAQASMETNYIGIYRIEEIYEVE